MKRIYVVFALALVSALSYAQSQSELMERRYNLLVEKVGLAGIGVETMLDKLLQFWLWAASYTAFALECITRLLLMAPDGFLFFLFFPLAFRCWWFCLF